MSANSACRQPKSRERNEHPVTGYRGGGVRRCLEIINANKAPGLGGIPTWRGENRGEDGGGAAGMSRADKHPPSNGRGASVLVSPSENPRGSITLVLQIARKLGLRRIVSQRSTWEPQVVTYDPPHQLIPTGPSPLALCRSSRILIHETTLPRGLSAGQKLNRNTLIAMWTSRGPSNFAGIHVFLCEREELRLRSGLVQRPATPWNPHNKPVKAQPSPCSPVIYTH